jgi:hypothetical protein
MIHLIKNKETSKVAITKLYLRITWELVASTLWEPQHYCIHKILPLVPILA